VTFLSIVKAIAKPNLKTVTPEITVCRPYKLSILRLRSIKGKEELIFTLVIR